MSDDMKIITPYLSHPLIQKANPEELEKIDSKELNEVITSVDLILRAIKEKYKVAPSKLHAGSYSSSIMVSRGWLFLDNAHSTSDIETIVDRICANSETTSRKNIRKNVFEKSMPKLIKNGLITVNGSASEVTNVMPYPISSKLFVLKELLGGGRLYTEQINQFKIMGSVQYFPKPTAELKSESLAKSTWKREYDSLINIDAIRDLSIGGIDYTFAKAYLLNKSSYNIWKTVLETSDPVRLGFKEMMELVGVLGGFASQSEIVRMTNRNPRIVNRLIRRADSMGIAQISNTLDYEDALSRPLETRMALNYQQLDNHQSILTLCRSVPDAPDILNKLRDDKIVDEGALITEFDPISVGRVRNALIKVGIIPEDTEDEWRLVLNKEAEDFLLETLTIYGHSRRILGEEIDIDHKLEEYFKDVDDAKLLKTKEEAEKDFLEEFKRRSL